MTDPTARAPSPLSEVTYLQWAPVFAGAVAAAALAFVLHAFGGAIGLAVSSTAPTWRDASIALWVLSGLYLILVALASYSLGGYLAGRLRTPVAAANDEEIEFRDGVHGLLVWALATLLTASLLVIGASASTRLAAPSGGQTGPATSVAGENIVALDLDRLFRGARTNEGDLTYSRAEAGRILLTASGHSGISTEDRSYLTRLVAARAGLSAADAQRRVETAIVNTTENISRARKSTVILAFMAGAAALLGAAAAWFAAAAGGKHRDHAAPAVAWSLRGPRVIHRVEASLRQR
jgi:hypothetical protein